MDQSQFRMHRQSTSINLDTRLNAEINTPTYVSSATYIKSTHTQWPFSLTISSTGKSSEDNLLVDRLVFWKKLGFERKLGVPIGCQVFKVRLSAGINFVFLKTDWFWKIEDKTSFWKQRFWAWVQLRTGKVLRVPRVIRQVTISFNIDHYPF